ncbi:hypothetical protein BgramDRAFT_0607 [Paraburkholderia graminis C4D1M]|uniref:Secreted protein n=1 Tax=Paraburkholderia graminis (strain ATCC 700544 / DSM 17151 / LMG 18924 / NCIMB 13744 / C4D1M) TaxID=396598 RepID=B1FTG6_PARG4|nr:hypothetical protein BgramDRAFT_0607 [Paraburkholderia graminis C4D1M]
MSYMTALPFIASVSFARLPASVTLPLPAVSNQCMAWLGPAWKTRPLATANNHAWLSARNMPAASCVNM